MSSFAKKAFFALIATTVLLVLVEAFLALTNLGRAGSERFYRNIFDPLSLPIPEAENPYVALSEFMNKNGLRGADFSRTKPAGAFRVICLGDSTTFSLTPLETSYPYLLEQALNQGRAEKKIEVINAGVPGTNLYQQRLLFEKLFWRTSPDLVILMTNPNTRKDLKKYRDRMKEPFFACLQNARIALAKSATYRFIRRALKGGVQEDVLDDAQLFIDDPRMQESFMADYREDLDCMRRYAKEWNFEIVVVGSFEKYHIELLRKENVSPDNPDYLQQALCYYLDRRIYEYAGEHGLLYIDATQDLVRHDPEDPGMWLDPYHLDAEGYRIFVARLVKELREHGKIPLPDQ